MPNFLPENVYIEYTEAVAQVTGIPCQITVHIQMHFLPHKS